MKPFVPASIFLTVLKCRLLICNLFISLGNPSIFILFHFNVFFPFCSGIQFHKVELLMGGVRNISAAGSKIKRFHVTVLS